METNKLKPGTDEYNEYINQFIKASQKIINTEKHQNIISIDVSYVDKLARELGITPRQAIEEIRVHFNAGMETEEPVKTYTIEDMEWAFEQGVREGKLREHYKQDPFNFSESDLKYYININDYDKELEKS